MDYVNLGQTGLKVSRICLGMMTYGTSQWRPWILDEADARPIVQRAVELGVNFFDTADMIFSRCIGGADRQVPAGVHPPGRSGDCHQSALSGGSCLPGRLR